MAKEAKVKWTAIHLAEDVKLWWRSRHMDIQDGQCIIDTSMILKQEFHSHRD